MTDRKEIEHALRLHHQPGEIIEIRYRYRKDDGSKRTHGARFASIEDAVVYAEEMSKRPETVAVWHNLNRIDPDAKLLRPGLSETASLGLCEM